MLIRKHEVSGLKDMQIWANKQVKVIQDYKCRAEPWNGPPGFKLVVWPGFLTSLGCMSFICDMGGATP